MPEIDPMKALIIARAEQVTKATDVVWEALHTAPQLSSAEWVMVLAEVMRRVAAQQVSSDYQAQVEAEKGV
jgi:hypothetical protein